MKAFYVAAESEDGQQTIAASIEAGDWEVARKRLFEMAREKWPATIWRPIMVADLSAAAVTESTDAIKAACEGTLRRLWRDADAALADDIRQGTLRKGQVLAMWMVLRDVVIAFNPKLADELVAKLCEAAEVPLL